jgi:hypothetical protein
MSGVVDQRLNARTRRCPEEIEDGRITFPPQGDGFLGYIFTSRVTQDEG